MRRWMTLAGAVAVVAVVVIGLLQASESTPERQKSPPFELEAELAKLKGAPAPLAALHAQAGELLPEDIGAFRARLRALRGFPVVINQWGSWCGPCRAEFPVLQRVSTRFGKRVAFLGIDGQDPEGPAREFLADFPVPYPSYIDRSGTKFSATVADGAINYPTTIFLDRDGKVAFVKQGEYRTDQQLVDDIERYLDV